MLLIGGVPVTREQAESALDVLRSSSGMMVRQPLQRAGNPLAYCDYHAAAAPYRLHASEVPAAGRGAAGRHLTKPAFVIAVESVLAEERDQEQRQAELERAVSRLRCAVLPAQVERAMSAFVSDYSYTAAMAAAAVAVLRKRHQAGQRALLRAASQAAVSACARQDGMFQCRAAAPCGTGDCRLARGVLAQLAPPPEVPPRGMTLARPANHVTGGRFSPDSMLPGLLERQPWTVHLAAAS